MTSNDEFEFDNNDEVDKAFAKWEAETADTWALIDKADADAAVISKQVRRTADPHKRDELYKVWKRFDTIRIEARQRLEESEKR